ncbi:MAG: cytochrome c peroxidase [Myxococcota bacterium]
MHAPVPSAYRKDAKTARDASWSPELAALGRQLFHEKRLSRTGEVSCASCHRPELAFTDGKPVAEGVEGRRGMRNTPSIVNRSLGTTQFWDGRAKTLEEQALGPIQNPLEMDMPVDRAVALLNDDDDYRAQFQALTGAPPTAQSLAAALAAYERSVWSVESAYDRYVAGDRSAMSASARRGMKLFNGRARCSECHSGSNFTDEKFHVLGVGTDPGRGGVTGKATDQGAFKTPSLRDLSRTAPYMHDGSMATLDEVVEYYDRGGNPRPNLDHRMTPLRLSEQDEEDLLAFLRALDGNVVELDLPSRVN